MFDKVIVSSDEHFKNFFPIVSLAWKKFFPDKKIAAAFVTDRKEDDPIVNRIRSLYDEIKLFPALEGFPTKNVAKMARFLYASEAGSEVCMIEDVDTIPLQKEFFIKKTSQRDKGRLLAVGKEVYENLPHYKNFPVSTMTGEGHLFKKFFNPYDYNYEQLFEYWSNFHDEKNVNITSEVFSDEGLIAQLTEAHQFSSVKHIERGADPSIDWIDRSNWKYDKKRLNNHEYIICNFMRPFESYYPAFKDVVEFIKGEDDLILEDLMLE
jgi:hypothetical protein